MNIPMQRNLGKHRIWIVPVLLVLFLYSCTNREKATYNYYNTLINLNNELLVQVYESLYKTKVLISSSPDSILDSLEYQELRKSYATICDICDRNLEVLESTGPLFNQDSILLNTYMASIGMLNEIYEDEFAEILSNLQQGIRNSSVTGALYHASIKLADNHIFVLDSVSEFISRYNLTIDSLQIDYHKRRAIKFRTDNSRISNSICISGDCVDGFGQQEDQDGNVYTGYFKNGLFHGKGKLVMVNGDSYEGDFIRGSFEGDGLYTWQNGDKFRGEWREDQINGIGTMFQVTGDTIFGYWENRKVKKF